MYNRAKTRPWNKTDGQPKQLYMLLSYIHKSETYEISSSVTSVTYLQNCHTIQCFFQEPSDGWMNRWTDEVMDFQYCSKTSTMLGKIMIQYEMSCHTIQCFFQNQVMGGRTDGQMK